MDFPVSFLSSQTVEGNFDSDIYNKNLTLSELYFMVKKKKENNLVFIKTMITSWLAVENILRNNTNTGLASSFAQI